MSKSKYNGVAPQDVLSKYGADTARMFILFKAPPEKDLEWDDADVEGQYRFLNRVWRLVTEFAENPAAAKSVGAHGHAPLPETLTKPEKDLRRAVHIAIKEISEDIEGDYQFNTAVSELMKLSNALTDAKCKDPPSTPRASHPGEADRPLRPPHCRRAVVTTGPNRINPSAGLADAGRVRTRGRRNHPGHSDHGQNARHHRSPRRFGQSRVGTIRPRVWPA
jgi:hypothetical protein